MADMTTSTAALMAGNHVHRTLTSDQVARRAARAKLAALFHFDADTRKLAPDQVAFEQSHGFLPTGPAKSRTQTPRALPAHPPNRAQAQQVQMAMSQILNPPAVRQPGTGQQGGALGTAAQTLAALQMLGAV